MIHFVALFVPEWNAEYSSTQKQLVVHSSLGQRLLVETKPWLLKFVFLG